MFSRTWYFLQIGHVLLSCSILLIYKHLARFDIAISAERLINTVTYMNVLALSVLLLLYANIYEQQNGAEDSVYCGNTSGSRIAANDVSGRKFSPKYVENSKQQHQQQKRGLPILEDCQYAIEELEDDSENESSAETLFEDSLEEITDKSFEFLMDRSIDVDLEIKLSKENVKFNQNQTLFTTIEGYNGKSSELEYLKKKYHKLKIDNHGYSVRTQCLKRKLSSQLMEIKSLKRTISSSMQILNSHIKENNKIYDRLHELQQNFDLLDNKCEFDRYLKNEKLHIDEQTEQIEQLLKDNSILNKELDFKNKVFDNLFEESSRLQSHADNNKEQIRILNSKIDSVNKEKSRLNQLIKDLNKKKFRSEEKILKIFKENTLLQSEFDNLKSLNASLIDENVGMSKKLRDSQDRFNSLKQINNDLRESNTDLMLKFKETSKIKQNHELFIKDKMAPVILDCQDKFKLLTNLLQKIIPQLIKCKTLLNQDFKLSLIDELKSNNSRFKKILHACLKENSRLKNQLEISRIEARSYKKQLKLSEEMLNIFKADEKDLTFSKISDNLENLCILNKAENQEELAISSKNHHPSYNKISTPSDLSSINTIQNDSINNPLVDASPINPFIISSINGPDEIDSYKYQTYSSLLHDLPNFKAFENEVLRLVEETNTFVFNNNINNEKDFQVNLRSMICDLANDFAILKNYATMVTSSIASSKSQAGYNTSRDDSSFVEKFHQTSNSKLNRPKISIYKDYNAENCSSVCEDAFKASKPFHRMSKSSRKENEKLFGGEGGEITPLNKKISILLQKESNQTYNTSNRIRLSVKPPNSVNV